MKKIIVAHPGRQHSFRLATALKNENMLFKYITTVYDKDSSIIMKITKKIIDKDNFKRANGRKCSALQDDDVIQICEIRGFIELALVRFDKTKLIYRWWNRRTSDLFGKKVAKYAIKNNVDAVIMYDSTARKCFEILQKKAPHIKRIMDSSIASRIYIKEIYQEEINSTGNLSYKKENRYMWNKKIMNNLLNEIKYTQDFLVPSNFVKESFEFSGVASKHIHIIPYGTNITKDKNYNKFNCRNKLSFLFVGQVISRKGVEYLIEAFSQVDENDAELNIVGRIDSSFEYLKNSKKYKNINFMGTVTHDKMEQIYLNSDVFVFPSLAEGMTLAGLEAMACGLPVICTTNTGINDLIEDEKNGYVIPISNSKQLKEKINWFIKNRHKISKMSKEAYDTALKYTWNEYENKIVGEIKKILSRNIEEYSNNVL